MRTPLRAVAHSRSGDKGNTSNITVIVYDDAFYPHVAGQLTAERMRAHYAGVIQGEVRRYDVPGLGVFNFVCEGALGGGVSRSLCLDNYGKALASGVLTFELEIPDELASRLRAAQITDPS